MWPFSKPKSTPTVPKNVSLLATGIGLYPEAPQATAVFEAFAAAPDFRIVKGDAYYMTVSCFWGELRFWTANKPERPSDRHGWASNGEYKSTNGITFKWEKEQPSKSAMLAMWDALARVATVTGMHQQTVGPTTKSAPVTVTTAPVVNVNVPKRSLDDLTARDLTALVAMHAVLCTTDKSAWPDPTATAPAFYAWADAMRAARGG